MTTAQIRILIIQANPPGTDPLGGDIEQRNLAAALSTGSERDLFAPPIALPAARIADLSSDLRRYEPHILHFIGHGDGAGGLLLNAPDDRDGAPLTAVDLADLIRVYQEEAATPLQLILLAGCQTGGAAELLSAHVTCAIGTTGDIDDVAVRDRLTPAFYAALADGRTVENALADAQVQLRSHGYVDDAAMLELFKRGDVAPAALRPLAWLAAPVEATVLSPLHLDYLRHWFSQPWRHLSLADLNSDRADKADLLDLYVPLPVDFALTVRTEEGKIVDWWAGREPGEEVDGGDEDPRNQIFVKSLISGDVERAYTRRLWADLGIGEAWLQPAIAAIQQRLDQQRTDDRPIRDNEYTQPPLEAHHAAALRTHFVLLGDPGSGKSSFLRHLTLCLAGALRHVGNDPGVPKNADLAPLYLDWGAERLAGFTPLYLEMRDVVRVAFPAPTAVRPSSPLTAVRPGSLTAEVTYQTLWRYLNAHETLSDYTALLHDLIDKDKLILLLDGLDEIPQADQPGRRDQVIAFVTALKEQYPTLRIIVSSRPYAYHAAEWRLTGFGHTRLVPLALNQLERLAQKLFTVSATTPPQPSPGWGGSRDRVDETAVPPPAWGRVPTGRGGGSQEAKEFVEALRRHPHMEPTLHANPLFFTLLAALWLDDDDRQLPATQADLYRRAVDLLLDKWTRKRADGQAVADRLGVDAIQLRAVLETLACTIHEQGTLGADTTIFHGMLLYGTLMDAGFPVHEDILHYLEQHAGLLISPSRNHFYFSHRSFQEHLAACELTCLEPTKRTPPVAADRHFPDGLLHRVLHQPQLWQNVAFLASDELMRLGQDDKVWALLDDLCRPYMENDEQVAAVPVALTIVQRHDLFALDRLDRRNRPIKYAYDELLNVAHRVLTDDTHFTPEERNLAGELLGRRPQHDTRPGVGCVNGLPTIDWVKIPETDGRGRREFIYQENEIRTEPTFWTARYPVTYGQFQAFLDAEDGFSNPVWWEGLAASAKDKATPGYQRFKFWNHPRENVNWYDAIAFCRWLTAKAKTTPALLPPELQGRTDWRITLPTEWQWEKAARGFDGQRYPWGADYVSGYANINEASRKDGPHYLQKTSAVGMYPPDQSPFGVMDLSGNVWEYCLNEYSKPDRMQETGDANRVVRGGSWYYNSSSASARSRFHPLYHRNNLNGFRVVVVGFSVPV